MSQNPERYYMIFEKWSMDSNQWSMLIDGSALLLAFFGVLLGFFIYKKQRRDNAKDAFEFFQSSLPELIQSIDEAIVDLKEFNNSLNLDGFVNPILSASLNDKFLTKINIVHLNRYYRNYQKNRLSYFKQLLVDSNFFGDYHSYISKEINFFRNNYQQKKSTYSKWRLLRSKEFFSQINEESENLAYKEFYSNWLINFNQSLSAFKSKDKGELLRNKTKADLIMSQIDNLSQDILPFLNDSKNAKEVSFLANRLVVVNKEITQMKAKIRQVLEKDIKRFENILSNMENLIE
ncbi:hypothetical protein [Lacinutrix chionoecetis]